MVVGWVIDERAGLFTPLAKWADLCARVWARFGRERVGDDAVHGCVTMLTLLVLLPLLLIMMMAMLKEVIET